MDIAWLTGQRPADVLEIMLADIQYGALSVAQNKTGAKRAIEIVGELADVLARIKARKRERQSAYLIQNDNGRPLTMLAMRGRFDKARTAAGLDPDQILRDTLRHTAITHLVQAGVDLPTVKRISGHKTLEMVERYSHQNGTHIRAAMDKLQARFKLES